MDTHVWLAYVVTAIVFSLAPGSGTVNSISNGLSYGTRKSLGAIVGLQIGLAIPHRLGWRWHRCAGGTIGNCVYYH